VTPLQRAFLVGAVCDGVILAPAVVIAVGAWGVFYLPAVLLWGIWTAAAVRGARSHARALDSARFYGVSHGVSAVLVGIGWALDPDDGTLALLSVLSLIVAAVVGRAARVAERPSGEWSWTTLQHASAAELASLLRRHHGPAPASLRGRRYRTITLAGRGPRTSSRSFFHAPHGPPVEGIERTDGPDGWFLVEGGTGGTHLDWGRSRRNAGADRRRGLLEVVVCVRDGDPSLLLGRRLRKMPGTTLGVGWFLLEDVGPAEIP